tara:strand:+ start:525 stop:761 length:237 start_codon:yes stop_codon:yes gene_type:complete
MKTKVLLTLVLGLGIGFGFAVGLVVLPEKAAAQGNGPERMLRKEWPSAIKTLSLIIGSGQFDAATRVKAATWVLENGR